MSKQWYVVHTYSGYENKVKTSLEERLNVLGLRERVGQILVPMEDVVEVRGGKRKVSSRKFFPGYLLIEAEMNDDIWYVIKDTPKVTGLLGVANDPTPLSEEEVRQIQKHMRGEAAEPSAQARVQRGENVRVIEGRVTDVD